MKEQDQIKKLAEMIDNSKFIGDSNHQIAEMALTMAIHWNQDTKEVAPEMYAMLEKKLDLIRCGIGSNYSGDPRDNALYKEVVELLAKARGES